MVLWLIPVAVILVAGFFMVRAFVRLAASLQQMRSSLAELGQMAPRLAELGSEMEAINRALENRARKVDPGP